MWCLTLNLLLIFGTEVYGLEKKCSVPGGCTNRTTNKELKVSSENLFDCSLPGLCQGDLDHEELDVLSEYQCVNLCQSFDNCAWYTYNPKTNVCFIFKTCPSLSEDCFECISGEQGCSLSGQKLLVIAGYSSVGNARKTEVIDIDDSSVTCQTMGDFPLNNEDATGALLLDDTPLVCGGSDYTDNLDECYVLSPSGQWIEAGKMSAPKEDTASILWDSDTLWVTGGTNKDGNVVSSTELITVTKQKEHAPKYSVSSKAAPDLPVTVGAHCLLKLNDSTAFLIGGITVGKKTFFLDINTDLGQEVFDFAPGPEMSTGRFAHVCGMMTNPGDGSDAVVAAIGGFNAGGLASTDLWIVGSDKWIPGPDIPEATQYSSLVSSSNGKSLFVVGLWTSSYYRSNIYQFAYSGGSGSWQWTKLDQGLQVARRSHVTMLIPDSLTNCISTN